MDPEGRRFEVGHPPKSPQRGKERGEKNIASAIRNRRKKLSTIWDLG